MKDVLTGGERVLINRLVHEYKQDKLPPAEQIRVDMARLFVVVMRLEKEIEKYTQSK